MAAACGITIVKRFNYRGDANEEYANTYWLTGTAPANSTDWRALFDAIVLSEKTCYPSNVSVIRGYGYDSDTGHKSGDTGAVAPAVWSVDLTATTPVPGTLSPSGTWAQVAGDAAVTLRWKTSRLNSKGKPIYLRKFFHPAINTTTVGPDTVNAAQVTNMNAFGTVMDGGSLPAARKITAAGHTDTIIGHAASTLITTRTLKRRGKRPGA